jgi:hypothetical protein
VIAIGPNKTMYVNAKPVQEGELVSKITELLENQKEKIILIKADEEVSTAPSWRRWTSCGRQGSKTSAWSPSRRTLQAPAARREDSNGSRASPPRSRQGRHR